MERNFEKTGGIFQNFGLSDPPPPILSVTSTAPTYAPCSRDSLVKSEEIQFVGKAGELFVSLTTDV